MTSWFVTSALIITRLGYPKGFQHAPYLLLVANKAFFALTGDSLFKQSWQPKCPGAHTGLRSDCGARQGLWHMGCGFPRKGPAVH